MASCKSPPRQAHLQRDNTSLNFHLQAWDAFWEHANKAINRSFVRTPSHPCVLNLAFSRSLQILTVQVFMLCTLCGGASSSPLLRFWGEQDAPVLTFEWSCQVGSYFQLEARKSCFTQEFRAGTVTFLTVRSLTPFHCVPREAWMLNSCIQEHAL